MGDLKSFGRSVDRAVVDPPRWNPNEWEEDTRRGRLVSGSVLVLLGTTVMVWAVLDPAGFFHHWPLRSAIALVLSPIAFVIGVRRLKRLKSDRAAASSGRQ
jgi:hypothetical protein